MFRFNKLTRSDSLIFFQRWQAFFGVYHEKFLCFRFILLYANVGQTIYHRWGSYLKVEFFFLNRLKSLGDRKNISSTSARSMFAFSTRFVIVVVAPNACTLSFSAQFQCNMAICNCCPSATFPVLVIQRTVSEQYDTWHCSSSVSIMNKTILNITSYIRSDVKVDRAFICWI